MYKQTIFMKHIFLSIVLCIPLLITAQKKTIYSKGGLRIDPSFVDEKVGDSVKKINTIFHFKKNNKNYFIKI